MNIYCESKWWTGRINILLLITLKEENQRLQVRTNNPICILMLNLEGVKFICIILYTSVY